MSRFLTIADVAEYLNVSAGQVRTLIKNGELPAIQVGGRGQWRIDEKVLAAYVERAYEITRQKITSEQEI
ncbi:MULTISPECIES: helix-turn-helix domain-containing protein [Trueperella]|uniref:Excisionase family DNA binding protein n=1 Tax=Trueperella abortisuis TaxID=445930 RepID=A0ABT9PK34_9ACTO|nr:MULTISPECIES: helix-turn-helix domain-containing protein [Trueperella]MCI7304818.1 helix-turn-helix domain-containing protein [Trueperella sp.]MDP9833081.1 excisionase family DNA binding protein [Trueperella abortisuis]MDY5404474.1 helix-turn-helix domain-containing protein [Trueperella sp.]